jgi:hypothetical protein
MPVHPHHGTEGLKPERMRQTPQQLVAPVFQHDGLDNHRTEAGHPLAEPSRHPAAMQRQVGAARAPHHQATVAKTGAAAFRMPPCDPGRDPAPGIGGA